jgi:hypothetical protein
VSDVDIEYVRRQVEQRFYAEALYFGALALPRAASPELHLYLGLAACGSIGSAADAQRALHGAPLPASGARPMVGNATLLVYEGFFHLLEAARRGLRAPDALAAVAAEILDDLQWYLLEDWKGLPGGKRRRSLKAAAYGATVLVHRMLPGAPALREPGDAQWAQELVDEELRATGGDAEFFRVLARPSSGAG